MNPRPGANPRGDLPRQVSSADSTGAFAAHLTAAAARALSVHAAALWLADEAGVGLRFTAGYGLAPDTPSGFSTPLTERSLQTEAFANGGPSIEDGVDASRTADFPPGLLAGLCVPLAGVDKPLGVLCVYDAQPRRFAGADVEHLKVLADVGVVFLEMARRAAELERAEKERTRLAQVTTHQLRSPITIAQSLLGTLLKGYAGPLTDQQRDVLGRVAGQLDFLGRLVNDFLDLAATKAAALTGQEGPVAVNLAAGRAVLVLQPRAEEKGVTLSLRPCREELVVWASEEGLDHVFHNLVENAVKYTPPGGQVMVTLARSGGEAQVTVADTGIGIPEEAQAHLFEEFYRAPNARASSAVGTGLGLAIVKGLVDRYRGRITVQSIAGEGTTFTVFLPLHAPAP